ncbi:uncharacterized protein CLUP02_14902 [Colletotrichum lupini]|uniref:Uncharacterized protein n=1 Tax=Colletotrichum lupini TaxID=145971 RepID=A0A9Q8T5P0_9PEZI|nr:uncharacterized protein CLUP02_14902 [Colletotrichum lupini]UQC89373.1 hypothetical protein CLUP02_14902 [Colletotrichum lupini]
MDKEPVKAKSSNRDEARPSAISGDRPKLQEKSGQHCHQRCTGASFLATPVPETLSIHFDNREIYSISGNFFPPQ